MAAIKFRNQIDMKPSFAKYSQNQYNGINLTSILSGSFYKRGLRGSVFLDSTRKCRWYSACVCDKGDIFKGSEVVAADGGFGGSEWFSKVKEAMQIGVDAMSYTGEKAKEASFEVTVYVQQFLDAHPYSKDDIVPVSATLVGTLMAWIVMPRLLRRCHKYAESSLWRQVQYEKSTWGSLEDPVRYLITFMAFSQIAILVAPNTDASEFLLHSWRGAGIISVVWFLQRWKTNVISRALAVEGIEVGDRDRLLTLDRISSVGLFILGLMALAEASGVAVQSMLTVGGIGGVATAFAARDILENVLSGLYVQISQPFSVGDIIEAGSVEGQVVEMGLTTTSLLTAEKCPVIVPNSIFSCQVIVNKSRAQWCALVTKIPFQIEDFERIPQITDDIKSMLKSTPGVFLEKEAPYCYFSKIERTHAQLTLGCNLRYASKDRLFSTEQDILLHAAHIINQHGGSVANP